jgi:hypothetical protein
VSSLVGTLPKINWAQIPRTFFCVCAVLILCCWVVLYRSIQFVQQGEGYDFQGCPLARKSRQFLEVFLLLLGRTVQAVQHSIGHVFLGTNFKEAVQLYVFGHDFQGRKL